jgi:hypothetical protein
MLEQQILESVEQSINPARRYQDIYRIIIMLKAVTLGLMLIAKEIRDLRHNLMVQ